MGYFTDIEDKHIRQTGELAEKYLHSDPNTSMIKQGMILEYVCSEFLKKIDYVAYKETDGKLDKLISTLLKMNYIKKGTGGERLCDSVRLNRNKAAHHFYNDEKAASLTIQPLAQMTRQLLEVLHRWLNASNATCWSYASDNLCMNTVETEKPKRKPRKKNANPSDKPKKKANTINNDLRLSSDYITLKICEDYSNNRKPTNPHDEELMEQFSEIMDNFDF